MQKFGKFSEVIGDSHNKVGALPQECGDWPALDNWRFDERYLEGTLQVHVVGIIERGGDTSDFCAIFNNHHPIAGIGREPTDTRIGEFLDGHVGKEGSAAKQETVLVVIIDESKQPKTNIPSL